MTIKKSKKEKQLATSSTLDDVEKLKEEVAVNLAGWQRARADYQNLKREWQDKQGQFMVDAKANLLNDLLPVYDHLKQALAQAPEAEATTWVEGIRQIKSQFERLLGQWGVEAIKTVGQPFNPELHEALQTNGSGQFVVGEIQSGYTMNGKLLYPARVVVGGKDESQENN